MLDRQNRVKSKIIKACTLAPTSQAISLSHSAKESWRYLYLSVWYGKAWTTSHVVKKSIDTGRVLELLSSTSCHFLDSPVVWFLCINKTLVSGKLVHSNHIRGNALSRTSAHHSLYCPSAHEDVCLHTARFGVCRKHIKGIWSKTPMQQETHLTVGLILHPCAYLLPPLFSVQLGKGFGVCLGQ